MGLGGPKPKKTKLPAIQKVKNTCGMKDRISEMGGRRGSSVGPDGAPAGRVTLRVVGLDRMNTYQHGSGRQTVNVNYGAINNESAKRSRFSQLRERRKSLGAVLAKHEVSQKTYLMNTHQNFNGGNAFRCHSV